jgi:hypothetical protein
MPFIGNKPASVPLTSADIADSIITSAKIVDGTIALVDLSATGTQDATTFLRGDNTFASAGGVAGITTSSTSGTALNITAGNDLEISAGQKISFLSTPPAINIDCSSVTVTLTNGSSIDFVSNSGIYCFTEHTQTGQTAIYVGGGGLTNVLQTSSAYTTTSGSGSFRFFYNAGTSAHRLQNNQGNTCVFAIFNLKLRNSI